MDPIKTGVIGVGHLGQYHAQKYAALSETHLVGIYDIDENRAKEIAHLYQCNVFQDIHALLRQVEAVSLAVPTDHHFQMAQLIMDEGVHCLVEKPITQTCDEASTLIQTANDKQLIFQVGHIERFNPAMMELNHFHMDPQFIESHRLAQFNPRGTEVSVILDLMIHDIDIILYLVNQPVSSIDATGVAVVSDTTDIANARIHFVNGAVANLTASRISQKTMRKMRLFQKDTYVSIDFLDKFSEIFRLDKKIKHTDIQMDKIGIGDRKRPIYYHQFEKKDNDALLEEIKAFITAVRGNESAGVSGQEGLSALSIAQKILHAMEQ